jgi:predicted transcriptional regulator
MEAPDDEDRDVRVRWPPSSKTSPAEGPLASAFRLELPDELVEALAHRAAEIVRRERRFLSKPALAEHLGVTERRVKTLREAGLPARKIGRDLYFDVDEVNLWLDREGR